MNAHLAHIHIYIRIEIANSMSEAVAYTRSKDNKLISKDINLKLNAMILKIKQGQKFIFKTKLKKFHIRQA